MRLWSFILALTIAIGLGALISQDPGYAFFAYHDWIIEMPLWICAMIIIGVMIASLFALWTLYTLFGSARKVKHWLEKRKEHTARLHTYRGLVQLAEGRWESAERYLSQSAALSDTPLINYLSAAIAAEETGSQERCNRYLQLALNASVDAELAVRLMQAEFQFNHGEWEKSIANLTQLRLKAPNHAKVLRLLCMVYEAMQDYEALLSLCPTLQKTGALSQGSLVKLMQKSYSAMLPKYAQQGAKNLISVWQESPSYIQSNPGMVCQYAELLAQQAEHRAAENVLRKNLEEVWHPDMMRLYGLILGPVVHKQLKFAESFLQTQDDNPILLLTLGRLSLANQLWADARRYLESSLSLMPTPETYAELAKLMERLGMADKKQEYFKKGLLLATQRSYHCQAEERLCIAHEV